MDKMYLMLPEFSVSRYNRKKALEDYSKINKLSKAVIDYVGLNETIEETDEDFKLWFSENKHLYTLNPEEWKIRKIKYDYKKQPQELSKKARNNAIIDLCFGVLTNKNTVHKLLNPGGYENLKRAAYITTLLKAKNKEKILETISKIRNTEGNPKYTILYYDNKVLKDMFFISLITEILEYEDIINLYKEFKPKMDPLSPLTWVDIHLRNMMGASLVPIYANSNANHAIIQHTTLSLNESKPIIINNKSKTSLHEIKDEHTKLYISRNTSEYLASAVDNAKDAILGLLNLNLATADVSSLLSRLGFDHLEVGLLLSLPSIVEAVEYYNRHKREGINFQKAIEHKIKEYYDRAVLKKGATSFPITTEFLALNLINSLDELKKQDYWDGQFKVLVQFKKILEASLELAKVVSATRSDTKNGAAGPDIAENFIKIKKVIRAAHMLNTADEFSILTGGQDIINIPSFHLGMNASDIDILRKQLLNSTLPYMNAFASLGLYSTIEFFGLYFPQCSRLFDSIVSYIANSSVNGELDAKTYNAIFLDVFTYYLQSTNEFFNPERIVKYKDTNGTKERIAKDYYINIFPVMYQKFKEKYSNKLNLDIINRIIYVKRQANNPINSLQFKTVGKIGEDLKQEYKQLWGYMLSHSDPEVRKMARDLFLYNYFTSGFGFTGVSFMHLVPTILKENLYNEDSNYIDDLYNIFEITDIDIFKDYEELSLNTTAEAFINFADLFVYNNLYSNTFSKFLDVYALTKDSSVVFFKEGQESIAETVEINLENSKNTEAMKLVKDKVWNKELQKEIPVPVKFFRIKIGLQDYYYEFVESQGNMLEIAIYKRVLPLGFKNRIVEYYFNRDASDCKSILYFNDPSYKAKSKSEKFDSSNFEFTQVPEMPEYLKDYYNNSGQQNDEYYPSQSDNGNDMYYSFTTPSIDNNKLQEQQAALKLFEDVIGESVDLEKDNIEMDVNKYPRNENWKDANNKPICK